VETVFDLNRGYNPRGGLVLDAAGNLYGTTYFLGPGFGSPGAVFEMSPVGVETVLHAFAGLMDEQGPLAGVVLNASGKANCTIIVRWVGLCGPFGILFLF
jgi:hypothetical protein